MSIKIPSVKKHLHSFKCILEDVTNTLNSTLFVWAASSGSLLGFLPLEARFPIALAMGGIQLFCQWLLRRQLYANPKKEQKASRARPLTLKHKLIYGALATLALLLSSAIFVSKFTYFQVLLPSVAFVPWLMLALAVVMASLYAVRMLMRNLHITHRFLQKPTLSSSPSASSERGKPKKKPFWLRFVYGSTLFLSPILKEIMSAFVLYQLLSTLLLSSSGALAIVLIVAISGLAFNHYQNYFCYHDLCGYQRPIWPKWLKQALFYSSKAIDLGEQILQIFFSPLSLALRIFFMTSSVSRMAFEGLRAHQLTSRVKEEKADSKAGEGKRSIDKATMPGLNVAV